MPRRVTVGVEEPGIRTYMKESEFKALLDKLEEVEWDHPVRWKLRTKWSEHMLRQSKAALEQSTKRKRVIPPPRRG